MIVRLCTCRAIGFASGGVLELAEARGAYGMGAYLPCPSSMIILLAR